MSTVNEYERYHGIVLTKIVNAQDGRSIPIRRFTVDSKGAYVVGDKIGLYIKYSSKRMSPWRYTFYRAHQEEIALLGQCFQEIFVALVCGMDGIVVLSFSELKEALDETYGDTEWLAVRRSRGQMYSVVGSDGSVRLKIPLSGCPKKICDAYTRTV